MTPVAAVTGGTGFVGRHVVAALAAAGWRVRLLARRDPQLDVGGTPVELVAGHLHEAAALDALVDGAELVVHAAAAIKARDRRAFLHANRDGTAALAAAARRRAPDVRLVMLSSLAARAPQLSPYACSKAAAERALAPAPAGGLVVLRPAAVYGPGDRETLALFRLAGAPVQPLAGAPRARVALIHAADVAAAVVAAARARDVAGVFELTDARLDGYRWLEILQTACRAVGSRCRPWQMPASLLAVLGRVGDAAALVGASPTLRSGKVREILHEDWRADPARRPPARIWRPCIGLEAGFADTVAWYRAAGWLTR